MLQFKTLRNEYQESFWNSYRKTGWTCCFLQTVFEFVVLEVFSLLHIFFISNSIFRVRPGVAKDFSKFRSKVARKVAYEFSILNWLKNTFLHFSTIFQFWMDKRGIFRRFLRLSLKLCQSYLLLLRKKVANLELRPQGCLASCLFLGHFKAWALSN